MKVQGFILYKIYYQNGLVYLGRTKQPLQQRIRGHLFKKPMHRTIDINLVTKMEYAGFKTEADMNLYEIYLINLLKPPLNVDDKTRDELTVKLPDVEFKEYSCHLFEKWKKEINIKSKEFSSKWERYRTINEDVSLLRSKRRMGEITDDECYEQLDRLREEEQELKKYLFK